MKMHVRASSVRRARRWVQLAAFLLFLGLASRPAASGLSGLFFWLDPLAGISGMVAARQVTLTLLIGGLIALALALVAGRAWCGWLCPLGTALDWIPGRKPGLPQQARRQEKDLRGGWRRIKYFLLFLTLLMALFGNLSLIYLDPITLAARTTSAVVWPALNAIVWRLEQAAYAVPVLRGPVDAFEAAVRGTVFTATQPLYAAGLVAALLFAGVLALNVVRPRFWCRYLCPLGALLGLVSKVAWLRRTVDAGCVSCGQCIRACPMGTIDAEDGYRSNPSECTLCLDCAWACPKDGQRFTGHAKPASWQPQDPSRRQFLAATGAAVAGLGLASIDPSAVHPSPRLVRPPGAYDPDFAAQCVRCGLCISACPTGGLQPGISLVGWAKAWTPVLVPRLGHCDFGCNACGQVCPTGAIPPLALADKRLAVMGHAYIDHDRCIPWVDGRTCLVCEEMCPLPDKAIQLEEVTWMAPDGQEASVRRPVVLRDRCVGCGICENRCPLAGEAAIRVYTPTDLTAFG